MQKLILFPLISCLFFSGCLTPSSNKKKDTGQKGLALGFYSKVLSPADYKRNAVNEIHVTWGSVFLGTNHGLLRYNMGLNQLEDSFLEDQKVTKIVSTKNQLYAATEKKGLYALPYGELKFYHTGSSKIRDALIPKNMEAVYCATSHGIDVLRNGAWRNIKINSNHEFNNRANDVTCIVQDNKGQIWAGTSFGVFRMNSETNFTFLYGDYQIIRGNVIQEKPGNTPLQGNLFYSIWSNDQTGNLLFSTNGGLAILESPESFGKRDAWKVFTGEHSISVMQNGAVASVSRKGNSDLPSNFVKNAVQIGDYTYAGTDAGLASFRTGQAEWELYNLDNKLPGDSVRVLYIHKKPESVELYVGTNGGIAVINHPVTG